MRPQQPCEHVASTREITAPLRLNRALALLGVASRRRCDQIIERGEVSVNQKVIYQPFHRIDPLKDCIAHCKRKLIFPESFAYYAFHKPRGFICSHRSFLKQKTIYSLFLPSERAREKMRWISVGRLDRESSGLLLLTNDGEFAHRVAHPRFALSKEYLVKVREEVTHAHLVDLSKGCIVEGRKVVPLWVKKVRRGTVKVSICEGRKREVRHLFAQSSLSLLSLMRIRIGSVHLGALAPAEWRELTGGELRSLWHAS